MSTELRRRERVPDVEGAPAWIVGDWWRWLRDPADVLRWALLVGTFAAALLGEFGYALRLGLTLLVTLVPRVMAVPRPFDFAFCLGMSFQAWGNVSAAFDNLHGYDKVVHFALPMAVAPLLYLVLIRLNVVPDLAEETGLHQRAGIIILALCFGFTAGGLYEIYEWFDVEVLNGAKHVSYGDTIGDLGDDALGAICGGVLLVIWDVYGWGTRRRLPARRGGNDVMTNRSAAPTPGRAGRADRS
jgi:hypothetical protein